MSSVQQVNVGDVTSQTAEVEANLQWGLGDILVISGTVSSDIPTVLKAYSSVRTGRLEARGSPAVLCKPSRAAGVGKWLSSVNPPGFASVKREQHSSTVTDLTRFLFPFDTTHPPTWTNNVDGAVNCVTVDDERSSSLIKGMHCGVAKPGAAVVKMLYLLSSSVAGDRVLDISVQTTSPGTIDEDQGHGANDVTETLNTMIVPTLESFRVVQDVSYQHNLKCWAGLADLASYDEDYEDDGRSTEAMVVTGICVAGPWSVHVERVEFEDEDSETKLLDTSLETEEDDDLFPGDFLPGDEFNIMSRFALSANDHAREQASIASGCYAIH
ncbi:hypothetical protein P691DRAFT_763944 [Macrolepiota fuliginosa MF-IS2]|uniref:Uncharacterized protein n=1 Tax=Macrolepiota fuliginosa MF-IS2 TaxID=1400762 RepID=A0A9P6BX99_9AGAR|nr:hypothetical protein P691DRAFT_763944 [Macrolepiota fuliginosa MF-IS2]